MLLTWSETLKHVDVFLCLSNYQHCLLVCDDCNVKVAPLSALYTRNPHSRSHRPFGYISSYDLGYRSSDKTVTTTLSSAAAITAVRQDRKVHVATISLYC